MMSDANVSSATPLAETLKLLLQKRRVDYVIDVGANTGQFGASLRDIGYQGPILSFEPADLPFSILAPIAAVDGSWAVHQMALGSEEEFRVLNVANHGEFNSFHVLNDYAAATFSDIVIDHGETVSITRLDSFVSTNDVASQAKNIFLKIDTQGHDLEVLRGAAGILPRVTVVLMELSVRHIYDNIPDWQEVIREMLAAGFGLAGLFPVNVDAGFEVIEFDGVFVNRAHGIQ